MDPVSAPFTGTGRNHHFGGAVSEIGFTLTPKRQCFFSMRVINFLDEAVWGYTALSPYRYFISEISTPIIQLASDSGTHRTTVAIADNEGT